MKDLHSILGLFTGSYINLMLIFLPLGIVAHYQSWAPLMVFFFVSIC